MQKIRKAVIPAAGYGTRFLPATKATPKEMLPIVDKPTIQYIVEEALASGIEEILIISGHAKRAIEDHFDSAPALEMELEKKGKMELLKLVRDIGAIKIHYISSRCAGLAMPSSVRALSCRMSRLLCCSATMSSTTAREDRR